jgi:competence protein ComEA
VLDRSAIGALGIVLAAMALSALAARPGPGPPERALPAKSVSPAALSALQEGQPISINQALAADLELLPGIGPMLARRIVEHRERNGPFRAPEELLEVHGIGPRTLERLRPLLRVSGEGGAASMSGGAGARSSGGAGRAGGAGALPL